jgi:hypothetical protein
VDVEARYEIRVEGVLDGRWFEGFLVRDDGRETVVTGAVPDQAALHGLLAKVRDLGVFLLSVRHLGPE